MTEFASRLAHESELTHSESSAGAVNPAVADLGASAGLLLRQAREAAGLHIAALAVSLKVPVKKLEALESDRHDLLPDAVFVRALAASICRTLKVDASQVLALLPQTGKPRLGQPQTAINTPFRAPGDGPGPSIWAQISKPAVMAGILLLMGALVLIFLPTAQQSGALSLLTTDTPMANTTPAATRPQPVQVDAAAAPVSMAEAPVPMAALPVAPVTSPTLSAATDPVMPAEAAVPTAAASPIAPGIIVFKAKGASWVEVTDAKKVVVLRRTLAAGEEIGATGVLPLSAVVGRADATQVQVRGQAFDLTAVSKDNVARFEVK